MYPYDITAKYWIFTWINGELEAKNYEAIIIITCSSDLSGTWSGFNLVKNQLEMNNMYIYDSRQVGAPVVMMMH